jgi:hypothetical protein
MTNNGITFEYIIYNINKKNTIINNIYNEILLISKIINKTDNEYFTKIINNVYNDYEQYQKFVNIFDTGIIPLISEYYNIDTDYEDIFNKKIIYTYSSNKDHYSNIISNSSKLFDITELILIFNKYCYTFKKFNIDNNISSNKSNLKSKIIYNKLTDYILYTNLYNNMNIIIYSINTYIKYIIGYNKLIDNELINISKIKSLLIKFENIHISNNIDKLLFDMCSCGNKMSIIPNSSELMCNACGYLYQLTGTVFDDNQFYNQESSRYKHARYEPSKHCKCWLERIQAKENNNITNEQIEKIENCIKRDNIKNKKLITIEQFRRYLKNCNLSELNEHIALIRKLITGISPPTLTYSETQDITNAFSKAVKAYNIIKPKIKSNMIFYPYLLRKLIELNIEDHNKKKELLSCIHLQGSTTLSQNDLTWFKICELIPKFKYIPTNRYRYI